MSARAVTTPAAQAEAPSAGRGRRCTPRRPPMPRTAGGADPPLPRVEPQHDLAQRHDVELALLGGGTGLDHGVAPCRSGSGAAADGGAVPRAATSSHCPAASRSARDHPARRRRRRPPGGRGRPARSAAVIPPVGTNRTWGNGGGQRLDGRQPAGGLRREELHGVEAEVQRRHDLGGGAHARGSPGRRAPGSAVRPSALRPGRDHEPGPRVVGQVHLGRGQDRAGADHQVAALREAAQDRRGLRRAEGRLRDRQPTGDQGRAQVVGPRRVVEDDDRDDPVAAAGRRYALTGARR